MVQPRKHHYLPQFYLRGFSHDQRAIFQIEKATGHYYGCQIKDTAAIRDFHEIDSDSTEDPYALEKSLARLEGELAEHLRLFLSDGVLNEAALAEVVGLLSMLRMRVPPVKYHIERSLASTIRATAKAMERAGKLPKPPPGLEDALSIDNLSISIMNWKCLELMFGMATSPDILNILGRMRATLYRVPAGLFFVTSDQPVALYHPTARPSDPYGVGPALRDVEITLPLTSQALLKLDHEPGAHCEKLATADEMKEFNRRTIIMAHNYVFVGEQPDRIAHQVLQFRSVFAGFRFDDVRAGSQFFQLHRFIAVHPESTKNGT